MSANQPPNPAQQVPHMIAQYQRAIEILTNTIAATRRTLERHDISQEEREHNKQQEQELQAKLTIYQTLINNLTPQIVAQNLQQRVMTQQQQMPMQQQSNAASPSSMPDNMSVSSTPGSPASFGNQNFANNPQFRNAQQQVMNKMNISANTPVGSSPQSNSFPSPGIPISSAATQHIKPPSAPNTPITPSTSQPPTTAANAAAVAAAAAAAKNNGMFTFPAMNGQQPPQQQPQQPQQPQPVAVQKPSAPSLDNDGVNRVLTKRKIQELVSQIDPAERLEPEVEDILLEIADEFIESVTSFACQLAKHRKSDTLEVKDVQLHLERNWNIRIPGFAADDIRPLRKPTIPSSHQSKVQAVNAAKSQPANTGKKDN